MFQRTKLGLRLTKHSLTLMNQQRKWLIFPLLAKFGFLLTIYGIGLWAWYINHTGGNIAAIPEQQLILIFCLVLFILFCCNLIAVFMFSAFAISINYYAAGTQISNRQSLATAFKNWFCLTTWILVSTTLGFLVDLFRKSLLSWPRINDLLSGLSWHFATFLIVPVMAVYRADVFTNIKTSSQILRDYAGIRPRINFSLGLPLLALRLISIVPLFLALYLNDPNLVVVFSILSFILMSIAMVLKACFATIIRVVLFHFMHNKKVILGFNSKDLENSIVSLQKWVGGSEP